jgi:class 3 adenylate cyclase
VTELTPRAGGGTTLTHQVRLEPRNLLGRTVAAVQVGIASRRSLERVYRRIDAFLTGKLGDRGLADPFEEPAPLAPARRQRLEGLLARLDEHRIDPAVVERVGEFLARAPAQEVARMRPLALARRLALDPEQVVAACLHGAREGLFVLLWDLLCPVCRIPSQVLDTLRQLREHGRCEACNLDFELDFANSVEMIFRAHPEIRDTSVGTYCVGGPAHSPHVVAQARVAAGERIELELALAEGTYRLRGPQLPYVHEFRVEPAAAASQWDLNLARPEREAARPLRSGGQVLALTNESDRELVVRVERTAPRDDALTAARAPALALFRELFPGEVLSPGQLVSVATVTLLVSALDDAGRLYQELGDARAFGLLHEHFRRVEECLRREGGAVVKTVGEGVVAVFTEPAAAVRAGLRIANCGLRIDSQSAIRPSVAVHRGPALAATLNDHLDYFGTTVNQAMHLPQQARGGELILTQAVAADPPVAALLRSRGLAGELFVLDWPGEPNGLLHRLAVPPESAP